MANCPIIDDGNEREQVYETIGAAPRLPDCVNTHPSDNRFDLIRFVPALIVFLYLVRQIISRDY